MTIDYDLFANVYKPVTNHLVEDAPYDECMFETYGEELDYILSLINNKESEKYIWTILDNYTIIPGYHLVNRIGYLITEKPWLTDNIEVNLKIDE